ncbi:MAG TPA: glycoside hydrolase family 78 protein [Sedimentisphaerales bacterium]|nr:glycoside hydrolase family 78 protein [Sedimentisphaerales bacterium]
MNAGKMKPTHLRCEYMIDPLGIDVVKPRLSWQLKGGGRSLKQSAYRILVGSNPSILAKNRGDLWDSGMVQSSRTLHVEYDGKRLLSRMRCYWKVCVWGQDGGQPAWSEPAFWTMGLLDKPDWKAEWISMRPSLHRRLCGIKDFKTEMPAPIYLRREFRLSKKVARATLYMTARGLFDAHINGSRVSQDVFAPEWTDYHKRIHYRTYDVTGLVLKGGNALGVMLGDGWYAGYVGWQTTRGRYGLQTSLMAQLEIVFADGSRTRIVTDKSWKCSLGPIQSSDFMMGESYDARRELGGWTGAGYVQGDWHKVQVVRKSSAKLVWQPSEPVRVVKELKPVRMTEPKPGVYVYDLGQNIAGFVRLRVKAPAGTAVQLRHAEMLNPDGTIYTENLRNAKATDVYITKGKGVEVWQPKFTFHGFQYVEVSGLPCKPDMKTVTALVVHSAMPEAGSFECSEPFVNRLYKNIVWGQRGNFISVPTDCPQRDERLGWMGDAQVFIQTASCNMDVAGFFTKWMMDVEDAQDKEGRFPDVAPRVREDGDFVGLNKLCGSPAWADAGIIIPWTIYKTYGDTRIIERHWKAMTRWMDYLHRSNPDYHRVNGLGQNYGDWLCIPADESFGTTSPMKELLATAFWVLDARYMAEMAAACQRPGDVARYRDLFENVKRKFQEKYVLADGRMAVETQTAYLLALAFELLPQDLRAKAAAHLVENLRTNGWHLSTGFIGVRLLNPVLTQMGYADVAYRLLNNKTYPSWLYPVMHGATTIWERWDGWTAEKGFQTPKMNSFNHYSLGSVGQWLFSDVAGISFEPASAGFERIVIRPYPGGGLTYARASYESVRGTIISDWKLNGENLTLKVLIPANTTALVYVPAEDVMKVREGGRTAAKAEGLTFLRGEKGFAVFIAGSGAYSFKSQVKPIEPVR